MSMLRSATLLALIVAFTAGCAVDEGDDVAGGDDETPTVPAAMGGCAPMVCGANSPCLSMNDPCDEWFYELPMAVGATYQGYTMLGMVVGPQQYNVTVVNGELRGTKPGFAPIVGAALVNKVFKVRGPSGKVFNIKIKTVTSAAYSPFGSGSTPAYEFVYTIVGDPDQIERNVCDHAEDLVGEYDTLFQNKWTTVVFEGELIDAETKRIIGYSNSHFNLGCAGNVLAKMHLSHHSYVSGSALPYKTTVAERQTLMKMYTADYCRDTPALEKDPEFTVFGEELSWTDDKAWFPHFYPIASISLEARWDKDGPICLETPRLKGTTDPLALALWPGPGGVDAAITAECPGRRPPTCSSLGQNTDVGKLYGNHLVSAYKP